MNRSPDAGVDDINDYAYDEIPLGQELRIMDEQFLPEFLTELRHRRSTVRVGEGSPIIANARDQAGIEATMYFVMSRHHRLRILLPKEQFVRCFDLPRYGVKPHLFVNGPWMTNVLDRPNAIIALVSAIGAQDAWRNGALTADAFRALRGLIDDIARAHPAMSFVSCGDRLLIRSDWTIRLPESGVRMPYDPEAVVRLLPAVRAAYRTAMGLDSYAVISQGVNDDDGDGGAPVWAISNHVSVGGFGVAFAQLGAIDRAARAAIEARPDAPEKLYMDDAFYHSLKRRYGSPDPTRYRYPAPMGTDKMSYVAESCESLVEKLKPEADDDGSPTPPPALGDRHGGPPAHDRS